MTTRKTIKTARENWEGEQSMEAAVCEWANCGYADIAESGDVYIEHPQRGHWLSDEKLAELVKWMRERRMVA